MLHTRLMTSQVGLIGTYLTWMLIDFVLEFLVCLDLHYIKPVRVVGLLVTGLDGVFGGQHAQLCEREIVKI